MTSLHSDLIELNLHRPFHYEQDADPGAVGAGKYWLDTNSGPPRALYRRNAGDSGWDAVGDGGGGGSSYPFLTYHPDIPPTSPSSQDDEFNAGSIDAKWTGYGSPDINNVTDLPGLWHVAKTGSGADAGMYQTFVPGAAAFTVAMKVSGNALEAGSNQVLFAVATSGGAFIVDAGMLNGSDAIVGAAALSGGFDTYSFDGNRSSGTTYWLIKRDASTNYKVYMSRDGINWILLASFSQSGTVGRIYLQVSTFGGSKTEAYYDWVRAFTSQTEFVGNTP
jgi:hypothetical protein